MRTLLMELRPATLEEASLEALLRQLAEAAAGREDVSVDVMIECQHKFPPDVHVALYRIAQEALNNVVKHAHASQVEIRLCCSGPNPPQEGRVQLCVSDNGCGFDPTCVLPGRLGLNIMQERAQAIGGSLAVDSEPGSGTHVTVVWESQ